MSSAKIALSSFVFTLINIVGCFLPVLIAVFYSYVYDSQPIHITHIVTRGEVNIICIPICISVLFTLYQHKKEMGSLRLADFFFWITLFWLVVATGLYTYGIKASSPNAIVLLNFSVAFLIWTVITLFVSKFIEDGNIESLKSSRDQDQNQLQEKFKKNQQ